MNKHIPFKIYRSLEENRLFVIEYLYIKRWLIHTMKFITSIRKVSRCTVSIGLCETEWVCIHTCCKCYRNWMRVIIPTRWIFVYGCVKITQPLLTSYGQMKQTSVCMVTCSLQNLDNKLKHYLTKSLHPKKFCVWFNFTEKLNSNHISLIRQ